MEKTEKCTNCEYEKKCFNSEKEEFLEEYLKLIEKYDYYIDGWDDGPYISIDKKNFNKEKYIKQLQDYKPFGNC